jgi:hypothetical protein
MAITYTNQTSKKKKTKKKSEGVLRAERELQKTLARVGYKGGSSVSRRLQTGPTVVSKPSNVVYSDAIPGNGSKKETVTYTGDEILGIALNHKSNYEPIRKDNKKAAVDSANMRRN